MAERDDAREVPEGESEWASEFVGEWSDDSRAHVWGFGRPSLRGWSGEEGRGRRLHDPIFPLVWSTWDHGLMDKAFDFD